MNQSSNILLIFILFCCSFNLVAQIDSNPNNSTAIPAEETDTNTNSIKFDPIDSSDPSTPNANKINGLTIPERSKLQTDDNSFSMFPEDFEDPGELYESRLKRQQESFKNVIEGEVIGATTDQYLGDFKTNVKNVKVLYRDYGAIDGDVIRVFVDKDIMVPRALLGGGFSGFTIDLKPGFNVIDFQALTQGDAAPNTAQVIVTDENDNIIASSSWGLANGVKATLIVVKE